MLEALPDGAHVPGGMEDQLPEGYNEPSAAERHYFGDDDAEQEERDEYRWSQDDLDEADDKNITFVGDKVQKKLDDNRSYNAHRSHLKKLRKALEQEEKALEQKEKMEE